MSEKIKVLHHFRAIENGGIEAFAFKNTFLIKNDIIELSYYSDRKPSTEAYNDRIKASGRELYISECSEASGTRYKRFIIKCRAFRKFCKKHRFDTVHVHITHPIEIFFAAAAKAGGAKKVIAHSHSSNRINIRIHEKLLHSVSRSICPLACDVRLACSEAAGRYMFGKADFTVIKNGIDTEQFRFSEDKREQIRSEYGIADDLVIGHVGRLSKIKNHKMLIKIFGSILKKRNNAVLMIVGEGECEKELRNEAEHLGISDKVIFTGTTTDPSAYLCAMDVFVMPSFTEGLGIAAIEAQCTGLPVVCSDRIPVETAITGLCSFLPLEMSPEKWAEHILNQCSDSKRKEYCSQITTAGYDIKETAQQLEKIYIS